MSLSISPNGKYALALARRSYRVLPCCWPESGRCACPRHHKDPKEVGKAPLTRRGVLDASGNASTLQAFWQRNPLANDAIALAPDYLTLDPDSDDARAECYENGLPDTLTRISRNKAFIFKAPPGLGNLKLTHKGASKAIDILNGYCLVYGTHRTGVRIFLENPTVHPAPAPAWVIEWIHKYRSETGGTPKIDPHTPPVRLGLESVKWWTGEKAVTGPDGDVDRSTTLFNIGMVLARANASVEAIATALEERDQSLGYAKYSERRDGPVRYAEIAARAVSHVATMPFRRVANGHSPRHLTGWEVRG